MRSALAILAGLVPFLATTVVKLAVLSPALPQQSLEMQEPPPPPTSVLALILALDLLGAWIGGWIAGRIAGHRERRHALVLGALIVVIAYLTFPHNLSQEPIAYQVALIVGVLPAALLGGTLRRVQRLSAPSA